VYTTDIEPVGVGVWVLVHVIVAVGVLVLVRVGVNVGVYVFEPVCVNVLVLVRVIVNVGVDAACNTPGLTNIPKINAHENREYRFKTPPLKKHICSRWNRRIIRVRA
jgi:hypothetical protein